MTDYKKIDDLSAAQDCLHFFHDKLISKDATLTEDQNKLYNRRLSQGFDILCAIIKAKIS